MFGGLVILWQGNFLLWSNLFGVLHASFIFTGITLFRLRKFYTMILWKHVLGFWAAFLLLILYLFSFFYSFNISLTDAFISSIIYAMPEIFFFISYILLVKFASVVSTWFPNIFYFQNPWSLCSLYCFYFHFQALNILKNSTVCVFLNFFKRDLLSSSLRTSFIFMQVALGCCIVPQLCWNIQTLLW